MTSVTFCGRDFARPSPRTEAPLDLPGTKALRGQNETTNRRINHGRPSASTSVLTLPLLSLLFCNLLIRFLLSGRISEQQEFCFFFASRTMERYRAVSCPLPTCHGDGLFTCVVRMGYIIYLRGKSVNLKNTIKFLIPTVPVLLLYGLILHNVASIAWSYIP